MEFILWERRGKVVSVDGRGGRGEGETCMFNVYWYYFWVFSFLFLSLPFLLCLNFSLISLPILSDFGPFGGDFGGVWAI